MTTAILIDGGFFIKRYRSLSPEHATDPQAVCDDMMEWSLRHVGITRKHSVSKKYSATSRLNRIFYYDCPPLSIKAKHPITGRLINFARSREARFRSRLHYLLRRQRKVALRLGRLTDRGHWRIAPAQVKRLLQGTITLDELSASDVTRAFRQKGVDMQIGLDIASLASKRLVSQIVLIAGDADFVPATEMARREGIDVVLDPMWQRIPEDLQEHIDGVRSTCPRPKNRDRPATQK